MRFGCTTQGCRVQELVHRPDGAAVTGVRYTDPGGKDRNSRLRVGDRRLRPRYAHARPSRCTGSGTTRRDDDRRVAEPGAQRVDADPAPGELRRAAAHEADDGVLRRRVDRIHRRRGQPRERRGRDDRAAVRHQPHGALPHPEDHTVEVRTGSAPVLLVRQCRHVALAGDHARVQERRVVRAVERAPQSRIRDVELGQIEKRHIRVLAERVRERATEAAASAGDQRPHGSSTTLPTLRRDSTSSCARSISSSGSSAPTSGFSAPVSQSPSNSPTAEPTSSGSSRISRPR